LFAYWLLFKGKLQLAAFVFSSFTKEKATRNLVAFNIGLAII